MESEMGRRKTDIFDEEKEKRKHLSLAAIADLAGRRDEAIKHYKKAGYPATAGLIAEEIEEIDEAIECYELGYCPHIAAILSEQTGRGEKAIELYRKNRTA